MTKYSECVTGQGQTAYEALDNAIEQIALQHPANAETIPSLNCIGPYNYYDDLMETIIQSDGPFDQTKTSDEIWDIQDEDTDLFYEGPYFYVSIDYNVD